MGIGKNIDKSTKEVKNNFSKDSNHKASVLIVQMLFLLKRISLAND